MSTIITLIVGLTVGIIGGIIIASFCFTSKISENEENIYKQQKGDTK